MHSQRVLLGLGTGLLTLSLFAACSVEPVEDGIDSTAAPAEERTPESTVAAEPDAPTPLAAPTPTTAPDAPAAALDGATAAAKTPSLGNLMQSVPLAAFERDDGVVFMDYVGAAVAVGAEPLGCGAGSEAWIAALAPLREQGALVNRPLTWQKVWDDPNDFERSFGISVCDVSSWLSWRAQSGFAALYQTSTGPETVQKAVEADPKWSPLVEARSSGQADYWFWGDGIDLTFERKSAARPLGEAGTLGVVAQGLYLRAPDEETHLDSLRAREAADGPMSDPGFTEMIAVLEEADSHLVQITRGVLEWNRSTSGQPGSITTGLADMRPHLQPYEWVGVGGSFDGSDLATVVLVNETAEIAIENAVAFERFFDEGVSAGYGQPSWSDLFLLADVEARGLLTIISLRSPNAGYPAYFRVLQHAHQGGNLLWADDGES